MDESRSFAKSEPEEPEPIILLGLGFTTSRLAKRLLLRRYPVFGVARNIHRFHALSAIGLRLSELELSELPRNAVVVHAIPPLPEPETAAIRAFILALEPRRLIYISASSVYGTQTVVGPETVVAITGEKNRRRIEEEQWIEAGPWKSLIVRPAAIYGPGRGVHVRVREGRLPRGTGSNCVSRIHVDDLAAILDAGVHSDLEGAWPVADDHPCPSEEIAAWCGRLLKIDVNENPATFPVAGRNVDGSKIRELLGLRLAYSGYQAGILACLAEENSSRTTPGLR